VKNVVGTEPKLGNGGNNVEGIGNNVGKGGNEGGTTGYIGGASELPEKKLFDPGLPPWELDDAKLNEPWPLSIIPELLELEPPLEDEELNDPWPLSIIPELLELEPPLENEELNDWEVLPLPCILDAAKLEDPPWLFPAFSFDMIVSWGGWLSCDASLPWELDKWAVSFPEFWLVNELLSDWWLPPAVWVAEKL
jgi:hypothetical protein